MKIFKSALVLVAILLGTAQTKGQEIIDAVRNNDLAKVKELIEKDQTIIGIKDKSGNTPLHNASVSGHVPIVKLLLANGADINAENLRMNTPLLESIQNGKDGQWMQPIKIDQIPAYVGVNVTSDGKSIFTYNLWASAGFIEELRQAETNKLK
jgi:hypothetical protein